MVQPRITGVPALAAVGFPGTIVGTDTFGEFLEPRVAGPLAPGVDATIRWSQAVVVDPSGAERRTSARPLITLRADL